MTLNDETTPWRRSCIAEALFVKNRKAWRVRADEFGMLRSQYYFGESYTMSVTIHTEAPWQPLAVGDYQWEAVGLWNEQRSISIDKTGERG